MPVTILPASQYMKTFWFESNKNLRASACYQLSAVFSYQKFPDIDQLKRAIQATVNSRYDLRSNFVEKKGSLKQIIHDYVEVHLEVYHSESEVETQIIVNQTIQRPFSLSKDSLFRFVLVLNEYNFTANLIVILHHLIVDGTQWQNILSEISKNYHDLAKPDKTDESEIKTLTSYLDWEKQIISTAKMDHWQNNLKDFPLSTHLPYLKHSINKTQLTQINKKFKLNKKLSKELKYFSLKYNYSLFNLLKVIWGIVLCAYTNQNKIVITYPFNTRKAYKNLKGTFVNTLFYTHSQTGNFLDKLKEQEIKPKSRKHSFLPTPDIAIANKINESVFSTCIAQTNFNLEGPRLSSKAKTITAICIGSADLMLTYEERGDLIECYLHTLDKLFDDYFLYRLFNNFSYITKQVISNPTIPIEKIKLMNKIENNFTTCHWNRTRAQYSSNLTLHRLFEQQVSRSPNNIAILFQNKSLSYKVLNQKANQLAHYLKKSGFLDNQKLVGIALETTPNFIVSVLAVLKAGGAYVPLDPDYPEERLHYMLEDTKIGILLKDSKSKHFPDYKGLQILVDKFWKNQVTKNLPKTNLRHDGHPNDLAYVVYTSGSTGKPKGVLQTHRTLVNLISWEQKNITEIGFKKITQFASIGFDISVQEIMYTLLSGFELHIVPKKIKHSIHSFIKYIISHKINRIFIPTAYLELVASEVNHTSKKLKYLQNITVAGEALKLTETIKRFFSANHHITLTNEYGPSETHVAVTNKNSLLDTNDNLPYIGKPIANTFVYVLDARNEPAPIGVTGELYIGGDGLMHGYLNLPELTQERMIVNKFVKKQRGKQNYLYKTGDLARWLPDGNLEYLGRNDTQVKIRGYRIEPTEIESVITEHPEIQQGAVLVKEKNDRKSLVAYFSSREQLTPEGLKDYLRHKLPKYMLPTHYVQMDKLPVNINGKVDRRALAELEVSHDTHYIPPSNLQEKKICQLWQDVLSIDKVGIEDDFFQIGGDSLKLLTLISRMKTLLDIEITITDFFKNKTIKNILHHLQQKSHTPKKKSIVIPLNNYRSKEKLFLFHTARGSAEVYSEYASFLPCKTYGIESYNIYASEKIVSNIDKLIAYYAHSIAKYIKPHDIVYLGGWSFGGILAYEVAELLLKTHNVKGIILFDTLHPCLFSKIKSTGSQSEWRKRLSRYGNKDLEFNPLVEKILTAGSIHEEMYRRFTNIRSLPIKIELICAQLIDPEYSEYTSVFKKNSEEWRKLLSDNLEITPIERSHESLFEHNALPQLVEATDKLLKRVHER